MALVEIWAWVAAKWDHFQAAFNLSRLNQSFMVYPNKRKGIPNYLGFKGMIPMKWASGQEPSFSIIVPFTRQSNINIAISDSFYKPNLNRIRRLLRHINPGLNIQRTSRPRTRLTKYHSWAHNLILIIDKTSRRSWCICLEGTPKFETRPRRVLLQSRL